MRYMERNDNNTIEDDNNNNWQALHGKEDS